MKIKMRDTTRADGRSLEAGSVVELSDETGQHLIDSGMAEKSSGEVTEPDAARLEAAKAGIVSQLEIAKAHGDVDAALKLDRINRGEEAVTLTSAYPAALPATEPEPTPDPTPKPPEPVPTPESTGASARRTLSGRT